jgi:bacterioferritin (cytochrome b1)
MRKEILIEALNEDLATELGKIIRYGYQAAHREWVDAELWQVFEREVEDELSHTHDLIEAVIELGGRPTTTPVELVEPTDPRSMLEADLALAEAEWQTYQAHARLAEQFGEMDLTVKLKTLAADERAHLEELRRQLTRQRS